MVKAIIKEQGYTYTYENVNSIKIDKDKNTCIINYQEDDEEHEEIGLMCPDFEVHLYISDKEVKQNEDSRSNR